MTLYSERFIALFQAPALTNYTVAGGKRAVIKQVDVCNWGASAQTVGIGVAGGYFLNQSLAGGGGTIHWSGMHVLHAGEGLSVANSGGSVSVLISGYLFSDP